jgi:hypothetical protein
MNGPPPPFPEIPVTASLFGSNVTVPAPAGQVVVAAVVMAVTLAAVLTTNHAVRIRMLAPAGFSKQPHCLSHSPSSPGKTCTPPRSVGSLLW